MMEELFISGDSNIEETTESLILTVDDLNIQSGVTMGMTTAGVALILSIALVNIISWFRRS